MGLHTAISHARTFSRLPSVGLLWFCYTYKLLLLSLVIFLTPNLPHCACARHVHPLTPHGFPHRHTSGQVLSPLVRDAVNESGPKLHRRIHGQQHDHHPNHRVHHHLHHIEFSAQRKKHIEEHLRSKPMVMPRGWWEYYIYIYTYICMCVCVCPNKLDSINQSLRSWGCFIIVFQYKVAMAQRYLLLAMGVSCVGPLNSQRTTG